MGVTSLSRDGIVANQKYSSALAGNDTADIALSSDFLIQEVVLNGTATSVTFDVSTLASTYKHLQLRAAARSSNASSTIAMDINFNGDTGNNYALHGLEGNGSSVSSYATGSNAYAFLGPIPGSSFTANAFAATVTDILDPFSTSKNKTIRSLTGHSSNIQLTSGLWMSTSAVINLQVKSRSGSFIAGSRFSLYGSKG